MTRKHRKDRTGALRARVRSRRQSQLTFERLESRLAMTGVVINELLASNTEGLVDQDGERNDWIELKNTSAAPVDITGWRLTDDAGDLTKWTFPATTLAAGAKLTIFASDKNRAVAGQELHTNFKLAQEGEYLALVAADGTTIVDSFAPYPAQLDDVSYGVGTNPGVTATETLVGDSTPLRVISPSSENAAVDDFWRGIGFNDSGWLSGTGSVGYDRNGSTDGTFASFIGRTLSTGEMPSSSTQTSAYVRYAFNLANKDQLTSLSLTLRFDDGFMAFINGREVKQVNFGDDFIHSTPAWNSRAGNFQTGSSMVATNRLSEALTPVTFDLTPYLPSLVNGTNVLAFHLVNGTGGTSDLLLDPELTATRTSGSQAGFMAGPTPGGENGVSSLGYVGDTNFSVDRGFYSSAFQVAITTSTPTASIRYTTDGSLPSPTNGTLYTSPINVSTTTVLRAIAYQTGYTSSNVDTQTYIFLADVIGQNSADAPPSSSTWGRVGADWEMDPDIVNANLGTIIDDLKAIPTVSLVMNSGDLFGSSPLPGTPTGGSPVVAPQGIYVSGKSSERYASFEFFSAQNALDQTQADVAVEIQGHSSAVRWNTDKLSFQVKFKYPFGDTDLNYPLFAGAPDGANATDEFDTFILDAIYNYGWTHQNLNVQSNYARFVTDQVVADLQNLASGGGQAAHGKYVHLYLNGLYWGMYNMHERPDDSFAAEYYGGDKDDYYAVKSTRDDLTRNFSQVEGGITAELDYMALVLASRDVESDPTVAANYAVVKGMLDVDQFIDYMIVHYYAGGSNDWPHNNWYATSSALPEGKWKFHAWDQEHAFPTNDNAASENPDWDQNTDTTANDTNDHESPGEIHWNLIENAEYRLRFADRVQELLYHGGALTPTAARSVYESRTTEIDRAIVGESARWGDNRTSNDPYTRADFVAVRDGILNAFFPARTGAVLGHFNSRGWIPSLVAPVYSQYGGNIASGYSLTISKPGGSPAGAKIYYTLDGTDPRDAEGSIGSTAIEYMGAVALFNATNVKARIYDSSISGTANDWSPLVDKTFITPNAFPLRITELHYNPPATSGVADEQYLEFIELLNTGGSTISLDSVQIRDFANTPYSFPSGITLGAGERIVVPKSPTIFQQVYGAGITIAAGGYGTQNLSNGGETVSLYGPAGELLQSITYSDLPPWPTTPDGGGPSLEIIDPLGDPSSPSNWRASAIMGGSPGTSGLVPPQNSDFDDNGQVDGNDFLAWQRGLGKAAPTATLADGDADGDQDVDAADLDVWREKFIEPPIVVAVVAASDKLEDEALATVLAGDEWILASTPNAMTLRRDALRARRSDAAFAAWDGRPAYRPAIGVNAAAINGMGLHHRSALTEFHGLEADALEVDEALAVGDSGIDHTSF